jgi:hypothetical protein
MRSQQAEVMGQVRLLFDRMHHLNVDVVICALALVVLSHTSAIAAPLHKTLLDQARAIAKHEAATKQILGLVSRTRSAGQRPPQAPSQSRKKSKIRYALIGATIGGGIGALSGAVYCSADCGGGKPRGAAVFGSIGAGIGAGAGVGIALLADLAP